MIYLRGRDYSLSENNRLECKTQLLNLLIDSEETATVLAKKFGVPDTLIRDEEQRKQLIQMAQQMAENRGQNIEQQMVEMGGGPNVGQ